MKAKFTYTIKPSKRRKNVAITIDENGQVIVKTPLTYDTKIINKLIEKHLDWIQEKLKKFHQKDPELEIEDVKAHIYGGIPKKEIEKNWWEELKYDFKSIISSGWNKNLIDEEMVKNKFFTEDLKEIEEIETHISQIETQLNYLFEQIEDWDEEGNGNKTVKKVKEYLKNTIKDLALNKADEKEIQKYNKLLKEIKKVEKQLKAQRKKKKDLEKDKLVNFFENLWDKYKTSLIDLEKERKQKSLKLNKFLKELGYLRV